ncbi:S8 family peptidase [Aliikangiella coralliicola]|uniref:S8 family serine peptidase n=1 Tax=Aliikangiella coralliicola TaxID=2592383 RepID=A0A545UJD5_9GAMM|nr:S8 family peptidase [Aliikangiella coralliicola]TQV89578.1 S8 family serine peptidase [Aliikangiella coralliicola]
MKILKIATFPLIKKTIVFGVIVTSALLNFAANAEVPIAQQLIIQIKDSADASIERDVQEFEFAVGQQELSYVRSMALPGKYVFKLNENVSKGALNKLIEQLKENSSVVSVEYDAIMKHTSKPNDARLNEQWHYHEEAGGINAAKAWNTHNGDNVVVAVLDTGYTKHRDLIDNIVQGYDFISDAFQARDGDGRDNEALDEGDWCGARTSSWHGTHVAGTIGAVTDNERGVAGVAYGVKILPVRVLGRCGGFISDVADAIVWAAGGSVVGVPVNRHPAKVINLSLGGSGRCGATYQQAINFARAKGATVVVSGGNGNTDVSVQRPANCKGVVSVAANSREGNRAYYSNFGAGIDVTAPGGETEITADYGVLSTLNNGMTTPGGDTYGFYQGTSMAAPHVAGIAALLYSKNASITPREVETILKQTARPIPGICTGGCGAGIVDAQAALYKVRPVLTKMVTSDNKMQLVMSINGELPDDAFYELQYQRAYEIGSFWLPAYFGRNNSFVEPDMNVVDYDSMTYHWRARIVYKKDHYSDWSAIESYARVDYAEEK